MKSIAATIASLAVLGAVISVQSPALADTIREVHCSNGKTVQATGTQSDREACMMNNLAARTVNTAKTMRPIATFKAPGHKPVAKFDNTAYAWTAACYREFGPNAKWPDDHLLQKCLSF